MFLREICCTLCKAFPNQYSELGWGRTPVIVLCSHCSCCACVCMLCVSD